MTSQLSQSDVASLDRDVAEMKKTGGNPGDHTAPGDAGGNPALSPAAVLQLEADWARFEAVFARGKLTIQYNTKFVKRHVAVASEALANRTVKKHRRRRTNVL